MCSCAACSIQRGRGQLPIPITDSGRIAGAGATAGQGLSGLTSTSTMPARPAAATRRSASWPLATRKLRCLPCLVKDTSSLPVIRHQAGKSSSTEVSVDRISSRPPRGIGSMCLRISSSKPLPQSRSPPSKSTSAAIGCVVLGCMVMPPGSCGARTRTPARPPARSSTPAYAQN